MAGNGTAEPAALEQAAYAYLASLKQAARQTAQPEVLKFVRWAGGERDPGTISGHEIAQYAEEQFPLTMSDAGKRADPVRAFLKWLRDRDMTATNLATHLRVRKANRPSRSNSPAQTSEHEPLRLTKEGHDGLLQELDHLKERRPVLQADLARAMADKDFRENAPLDAARNEQAHLEGRIRELEATLHEAVVIEKAPAPEGDIAQIGHHVTIRDLRTGQEKTYMLVNTDEVRSGQGKLSVASPVGKAVHQRRAGDEVDVDAPSGTIRFRIEAIRGQ